MKASAARILDRAQFEIPEYALGDQELWTYKLVKQALVDAFRMLRNTSGRVGPGGLKASWPEYAEAGDYPPEKTKTSPYSTHMTITRMEMILLGWREEGVDHPAWLNGGLMIYPDFRAKLIAWVFSELHGEATVDLCHRRKWSVATFKRHRDKAAGMIAERLNRAGMEIW